MFKNLIYIFFFIFKIFFPLDKNLLIFGDRAGKRFCDNSRYLFFHINSLKKKRCVWLSQDENIVKQVRDMGYESYLTNSLMGIFLSLRADWHIYNFAELDINSFLTKFTKNINLWHGILFKKFKKNKSQNFFFKLSAFFFTKYLVYPNKLYSKHILNHYPKWKYKLLISNQPRNILLTNNNKENFDRFTTPNEKKICSDIKKKKKKIIGYFPTWRENGLELFPNTNSFSDIIRLNIILKKNNTILLIKKHPNSFKKDEHNLYNKDIDLFYKKIKKLSNFYLLDYNTDLNSVMHLCDTLISDYSGAIFDYLLLNRPIIFYVPDLESYKKNPGIHFNLDTIKIGPVVESFQDLLKTLNIHLKNPIKLNKTYCKKIKNFKNKIFIKNECFNEIVKVLD